MSEHDQKPEAAPRIRLAKNVDLSKAKSGCSRCNGRGIVAYKTLDLGDGNGPQRVPIICRCVTRNQGVKLDELDRIMAEAQQQIESGVFHEHLAADFHAMPDEHKPRVLAALFRDTVDARKTDAARQAITKTVELLERRKDWMDLLSKAIRILMRDASDEDSDSATRQLAQDAMTAVRRSMN